MKEFGRESSVTVPRIFPYLDSLFFWTSPLKYLLHLHNNPAVKDFLQPYGAYSGALFLICSAKKVNAGASCTSCYFRRDKYNTAGIQRFKIFIAKLLPSNHTLHSIQPKHSMRILQRYWNIQTCTLLLVKIEKIRPKNCKHSSLL